MRIQQIATLTGASQKAIRLYEALGLLGPVPRRGAYRFYSADHVTRVAMARRAQAFGFTLAEVKGAQRGGQIDWAAVLDLVQDKRRALAAERARLARLDLELQASGDELRPCAAAAEPPPPDPAASCLARAGHEPGWLDRMPGHWQMRRTVLQFCGFSPVCITSYGAVRGATPQRIAGWLADARRRGAKAARQLA